MESDIGFYWVLWYITWNGFGFLFNISYFPCMPFENNFKVFDTSLLIYITFLFKLAAFLYSFARLERSSSILLHFYCLQFPRVYHLKLCV